MVKLRHFEHNPIEARPEHPVPSTVPEIHPVHRIDSSSLDGLVNAKNSVPPSRRLELRGGALAVGGGVGLGLVGLGLAVGVEEGLPRAFGGQGAIGAAINPDEKQKAPDATTKLLFSPLTILAIGAIIVAAMVWGGK